MCMQRLPSHGNSGDIKCSVTFINVNRLLLSIGCRLVMHDPICPTFLSSPLINQSKAQYMRDLELLVTCLLS